MILFSQLKIEQYKNLPQIDIPLKSINIIIGKAGTGKTNLLEAVAMLGMRYLYPDPAVWHRMVRFSQPLDWFPNLKADNVIKIQLAKGVMSRNLTVSYQEETNTGIMELFMFDKFDDIRTTLFVSPFEGNKFKVNPRNLLENDELCPIRPYCFDTTRYSNRILFADLFLEPPLGRNLARLVAPDEPLHEIFQNMLSVTGHRAVFEYGSGQIRLARVYDIEQLYGSIPYQSVSESWQKYFFLYAALVSNQKAFILLDNPASGIHSEHIDKFAQHLSENDQNQYLFSTKNPVLVKSLLRKNGEANVNIIACHRKTDPYTAYAQVVPEDQLRIWAESDNYSLAQWES